MQIAQAYCVEAGKIVDIYRARAFSLNRQSRGNDCSSRHAVVTVQSETSRLTGDQLIAALQEALEKASNS